MSEPQNNPIRAALSANKLLCGPFQLLSDRAVTEIILGAGFDFVLVDAEHRALNAETIEDIIRTAQGLRQGGDGARSDDCARTDSIHSGFGSGRDSDSAGQQC